MTTNCAFFFLWGFFSNEIFDVSPTRAVKIFLRSNWCSIAQNQRVYIRIGTVSICLRKAFSQKNAYIANNFIDF